MERNGVSTTNRAFNSKSRSHMQYSIISQFDDLSHTTTIDTKLLNNNEQNT